MGEFRLPASYRGIAESFLARRDALPAPAGPRYFRQLTAERVVTRFERGRPIRSWRPMREGERNDALDTFVYAHSALHGLISMGLGLNEEAEGVVSCGARKAKRAN